MDDGGPYRSAKDPLGPEVARFRVTGRPPFASRVTVAALGLLPLLGAALPPDAALASMAAVMGGGVFAERLPARAVVALRRGGLRVPGRGPELRWGDVTELRVDGARDRRRLTLSCAASPPLTLNGVAEALLDAIEAALVPRQVAELRARLADGGAILMAGYRLDQRGLYGRGADLPWTDLGPARRDDHHLRIESAIGPFAIALAELVNPGALIALVGERGRLQ